MFAHVLFVICSLTEADNRDTSLVREGFPDEKESQQRLFKCIRQLRLHRNGQGEFGIQNVQRPNEEKVCCTAGTESSTGLGDRLY